MISTTALLAFAVVSTAGLCFLAMREHRDVLRRRRRLLDAAAELVEDGSVTIAPDGFPVVDGRLADRRHVRIELVADTLVFRRLPQLWLKLTLAEHGERRRPSIGALSRPTGAEFYSVVHDLPEWIEPPQTDGSILMRGRGAAPHDVERASAMFRSLFMDPTIKEVAITPRGVRLVRQASEGDRGAHLLLRQVRFPMDMVPKDMISEAIGQLQALSETLRDDAAAPEKLSA